MALFIPSKKILGVGKYHLFRRKILGTLKKIVQDSTDAQGHWKMIK